MCVTANPGDMSDECRWLLCCSIHWLQLCWLLSSPNCKTEESESRGWIKCIASVHCTYFVWYCLVLWQYYVHMLQQFNAYVCRFCVWLLDNCCNVSYNGKMQSAWHLVFLVPKIIKINSFVSELQWDKVFKYSQFLRHSVFVYCVICCGSLCCFRYFLLIMATLNQRMCLNCLIYRCHSWNIRSRYVELQMCPYLY